MPQFSRRELVRGGATALCAPPILFLNPIPASANLVPLLRGAGVALSAFFDNLFLPLSVDWVTSGTLEGSMSSASSAVSRRTGRPMRSRHVRRGYSVSGRAKFRWHDRVIASMGDDYDGAIVHDQGVGILAGPTVDRLSANVLDRTRVELEQLRGRFPDQLGPHDLANALIPVAPLGNPDGLTNARAFETLNGKLLYETYNDRRQDSGPTANVVILGNLTVNNLTIPVS